MSQLSIVHVSTNLTVTELAVLVSDTDDLVLCFLMMRDCSRSLDEQSLHDRLSTTDEGLLDESESEKGRDFTNWCEVIASLESGQIVQSLPE